MTVISAYLLLIIVGHCSRLKVKIILYFLIKVLGCLVTMRNALYMLLDWVVFSGNPLAVYVVFHIFIIGDVIIRKNPNKTSFLLPAVWFFHGLYSVISATNYAHLRSWWFFFIFFLFSNFPGSYLYIELTSYDSFFITFFLRWVSLLSC